MRQAFIFPVILFTTIIMLSGCKKLNNSFDINDSMLESANSSSQADMPDLSSSENDETISLPSSSKDKKSNSSDKDILEFGSIDIIDGLLELEREGLARGEIEAGMKIDYRKAVLAKGSNITFIVDCKQQLTDIKITLTESKTGKCLEDNVIGKGELYFEIDEDGEYVVTIENCSDKGTYFTIEYCINDKANTI